MAYHVLNVNSVGHDSQLGCLGFNPQQRNHCSCHCLNDVSAISPLVAALRVHAVTARNWRWVLPVWLLGMVPIGTNIVSMLSMTRGIIVVPDARDMDCHSTWVYGQMSIITRGSVIVSDILVVAATWYYISRTSSVKTQLVRDMWAARPNLTTVMFRDGTLYFLTISLLNIVDLIVNVITISGSSYVLDLTSFNTAISSILISRFLICIREAAERPKQALGSQSLSFIDSQGSASPQPWLSGLEFASDIANRSAENSHAGAFPDLDDNDDNLDSGCGEEAQIPEHENGIEMEEYAAGDSIREYCGLNSKRTSILAKCGVREGMSVPNCPVPVNKTMLSISSTAHSRARFVTGRPHRLGLLTETRLRATRTPTETCLEQRRVGTYKNVRASEHISPRNEPTGGGHAHVALTGLSRRPGHVHAEDGGGGGLVGDIHHERSSM
ncbi:predicted protein [Postia placenta Mad-698-R]|nr:predicted protein [Postia placenta Mad-698-R]